ncbi:hypothetical protein KCP69_15300 [Salmonella enterica subsp. enterica]|nr:hypothetical protein KCP69_15300 [Salmonella enterica subsp. enterica]
MAEELARRLPRRRLLPPGRKAPNKFEARVATCDALAGSAWRIKTPLIANDVRPGWRPAALRHWRRLPLSRRMSPGSSSMHGMARPV